MAYIQGIPATLRAAAGSSGTAALPSRLRCRTWKAAAVVSEDNDVALLLGKMEEGFNTTASVHYTQVDALHPAPLYTHSHSRGNWALTLFLRLLRLSHVCVARRELSHPFFAIPTAHDPTSSVAAHSVIVPFTCEVTSAHISSR